MKWINKSSEGGGESATLPTMARKQSTREMLSAVTSPDTGAHLPDAGGENGEGYVTATGEEATSPHEVCCLALTIKG